MIYLLTILLGYFIAVWFIISSQFEKNHSAIVKVAMCLICGLMLPYFYLKHKKDL